MNSGFYTSIKNKFKDSNITANSKSYKEYLLCFLILTEGIRDYFHVIWQVSDDESVNDRIVELTDLLNIHQDSFAEWSFTEWDATKGKEIHNWIVKGNLWYDEEIVYHFMKLAPLFLVKYLKHLPKEQLEFISNHKKIILATHKADCASNYKYNDDSENEYYIENESDDDKIDDNNWRIHISKNLWNDEKFFFEFLEIDPSYCDKILPMIPEKLLNKNEFVFNIFKRIPDTDFEKICPKILHSDKTFMNIFVDYYSIYDTDVYSFVSASPLYSNILSSIETNKVSDFATVFKNKEIHPDIKQYILFPILNRLESDGDFRYEFLNNLRIDVEFSINFSKTINISDFIQIINHKEIRLDIKCTILFTILEKSKIDINFFSGIINNIKKDEEFKTNFLFILKQDEELLATFKGLFQKKPSKTDLEKNNKRAIGEIDTTENDNNKKSKH